MTSRCPSELALEAHLLEPERSPISAHVTSCPRCSARLAQMRAEGEEFARTVFPETVDAIEEAAAHRPWWRHPAFVLPIPAVAALATVLVLLRPSAPPEEYVGVKGGAGGLGFTVYAAGPGGAAPVLDGGTVGARAPIRFRIRNGAPCHLWILSVDGGGVLSRLYPTSGDGGAPQEAGSHELPGGAVLDGVAGPERIYSVCSPGPVGWAEIERAVRSASDRPAGARRPAPLTGLPPGTAWGSVLLEKRP